MHATYQCAQSTKKSGWVGMKSVSKIKAPRLSEKQKKGRLEKCTEIKRRMARRFNPVTLSSIFFIDEKLFTSHSKSASIKSRCLLVFFDSNKANHHTLLTLLIQVNNDQFLIILPSLE